jgi:hypothetical protein
MTEVDPLRGGQFLIFRSRVDKISYICNKIIYMAYKSIRMDIINQIKNLNASGKGIKAMARILKISRNSVISNGINYVQKAKLLIIDDFGFQPL